MTIVCLGGSSGIIRVIKSLLEVSKEKIVAVVGVHDSGGHTGELRKKYKIPAVGDIREIIGEISGISLFNYKFDGNKKLGNYLLAFLTLEFGLTKATQIILKALNMKKLKIFPVSDEATNLFARTIENEIIEGEAKIEKCNKIIESIWLSPQVKASKSVLSEIKKARVIIFCPGSLYSSLLALLLYKGIKSTIKRSKAKKILILNVREDEETHKFSKISELVQEFERYGFSPDLIIANEKRIDERYFVVDIFDERVICDDLLSKDGLHSVEKLAKVLKKII